VIHFLFFVKKTNRLFGAKKMNCLIKILRRRLSSNVNDCKVKTDKCEHQPKTNNNNKNFDDDILLRYWLTTSFFGGIIGCCSFLHRMDNPRRYYSHQEVDNRRKHMLLYTGAYTARGIVFGPILVPAYCTLGLLWLIIKD